jgi:ankyrin repeat protein
MNVVQMLLDANADIEAVNHEGETPLHLATERCETEVMKLLVDRSADINAQVV